MTAPDPTPNHPAVDAAERAATRWMEDRELETDLDGTAYMLAAALPHLIADDLRDTPAGRELMAEGWEEGALHQARGSAETRRVLASALPNPYRTAS